jgi:hypothetical protein
MYANYDLHYQFVFESRMLFLQETLTLTIV